MRFDEARTRELFAFVILCLLVIMILHMIGCANNPTVTSLSMPDTIVKYDLAGTINGIPFEGIGVIPRSDSYVMRITSKEDVDLMTVTSCHREIPAESVIQAGWFQPRRGYEYTYAPSAGIEDTGSCLMRIGTYNGKVEGQNAHAIIDFASPQMTLGARNFCNGASGRAGGVSMCQSKVGLVQRLVFDGPTRSLENSPDPKGWHDAKICPGKWLDPKTFEYNIVAGECVIAFMETAPPNRIHRHTVIGYTKVPIRLPQGN